METTNVDTMQRRLADKWTGERCYLNGAPAKITGRLNRFATVAPDNSEIATAEYSWHTVNRIMERGGFFDGH